MTEFKSAIKVRGDILYCPLPFYIDSYWTCEPNCYHCYARRLNRTWGNDFRKADPEKVKKKLLSKRGKSPLDVAIQNKKTIRLGNRSDPFQDCEEEHGVSAEILNFLLKMKWETIVQTKYPTRLSDSVPLNNNTIIILCEVLIGLEKDWELLERRRTEHPKSRFKTLKNLIKKGFQVGVMGEPFIPGYHTVQQFEDMMKLLKCYGLKRFNIYNLHFNDLVAKNFNDIGLDIERIWVLNQDKEWRKILKKLLYVSERYGIILGCPDFVNSGWGWVEKANTCCGIDVKNPCTFNTHYFKLSVQKGEDPMKNWDGVGDRKEGERLLKGENKFMYSLKDIIEKKKGFFQ